MMKKLLSVCFSMFYVFVFQAQTVQLSAPLQQLYAVIDTLPCHFFQQKPLIGITMDMDSMRMNVRHPYVEAVIKAGGIPYLIPITDDVQILNSIVAQIDGIVLTGGDDIDPKYYNEEPHEHIGDVIPQRDVSELLILRLASKRGVPILGICRGLQLINVGFGGTLYQDIPSQFPSAIKHRQEEKATVGTHRITLVEDGKLHKILGQTEVLANSHHHQGIKMLAPGFLVTGYTDDGLPEVIESCGIIAVQYHPEIFAAAGDTTTLKIFRYLTDQAKVFKQNKQ